jgi:hypothetical protein
VDEVEGPVDRPSDDGAVADLDDRAVEQPGIIDDGRDDLVFG